MDRFPTKTIINDVPLEIILKILANLVNVETLLSAMLTCRYLYHILPDQPDRGKSVIKSILSSNRTTENVLSAVTIAVQDKRMPNVIANIIFWHGWDFFKDRFYDIPFGSDIGFAYAVINLPQDGISVLEAVANGTRALGLLQSPAKQYKYRRFHDTKVLKPPFNLIFLGRILRDLHLKYGIPLEFFYEGQSLAPLKMPL